MVDVAGLRGGRIVERKAMMCGMIPSKCGKCGVAEWSVRPYPPTHVHGVADGFDAPITREWLWLCEICSGVPYMPIVMEW